MTYLTRHASAKRRIPCNNCPVHTNTRSKARESKPWFNEVCTKLYNNYKRALRRFNSDRSTLNRFNLTETRKKYKLLQNKLRSTYLTQEGNMINTLRKNNPRAFYRKVNKRKKSPIYDITMDEFVKHLKNVSGPTEDDNNNKTNDINDYDNQTWYEELDIPVTEQEMLYVLDEVKRIDGLLYEFFIECKDVMVPILGKLFNVILQTGIFPENWCKCTILPNQIRGQKRY